MEIFWTKNINGDVLTLNEEESRHCIKVLRHRTGDSIQVVDGLGKLYSCRLISDSPKAAQARILETQADWGGHDYFLEMAVCPTKNIDRYEWFAEKACETGVDRIVPMIAEHSERKTVKPERIERILLSATKQSLKGKIPQLGEACSAKDYILGQKGREDVLKLIAYCFENEDIPRKSIAEALKAGDRKEISILIGPEGDFSREEAALALECGFVPVHLGPSRLRTETAALTAVTAVYLHFMSCSK